MAINNGTGPPRRQYPDEVWEDMKPLIKQKYIVENATLEETMKQLLDEKDFQATEKMYKTRIKKWGLSKYIKDDKALAVLNGDAHKRHTIQGRPITAEEADRHLRRKKNPIVAPSFNRNDTWPQDGIDQMQLDIAPPFSGTLAIREDKFIDSEFLSSPIAAQPSGDQEFNWPSGDWVTADDFARRGTLQDNVYSPVMAAEDIDDIAMDMELTDLIQGNNSTASQEEDRIVPVLLGRTGLRWTTENFLFSMQELTRLTATFVPQGGESYLRTQRFNKVWDHFSTYASLVRQNNNQQALISRSEAQTSFQMMLQNQDPWLLLSLCLLLNDCLTNPATMALSASFLNEMATWAENNAPHHPIVQLVRFLQMSDDATGENALALLEGTIRMASECLQALLKPHHDLSLEVARLHTRIMTSAKMHSSAIMLLSNDLAVIEQHYGHNSLPNLLRRSSLARCYFMDNNFDASLQIYQQILCAPLVNEPHLADIKYGALYFVAKSYAAREDYAHAIAYAQEALVFARTQHKEDHYWVKNAQSLIKEFNDANISMAGIFGDRVRDGVTMDAWSVHGFTEPQAMPYHAT